MDLFSTLNAAQLDAVNTLEGPLLVLAGAGSGKTRVVTFRIINLINNGVPPHKILGLTFTNKAAGEMKERIRSLTNSNVLICTFHSLGARMLRESIQALGYERDFTIYDEDDIEKVLKACLSEIGLKEDTKVFRQLISKAKDRMHMPEQVSGAEHPYLPQVYAAYQNKLKTYNALDFDDLLFLSVRLLREHPKVLDTYQNRWQYLLIDEYQDTNEAQYNMINYLVAKSRNLCVVGDPDQSIYSWRGANIRNILNFETDYPGAKIVRLEQNYRSRSNILEAANAVVVRNTSRYDKNLWSDLGEGEKIKLFTADTEREEAAFIADRIKHHQQAQHLSLNQMVVFYRTNAQSRAFEDSFIQRKISYVIVGGISFYQRREIKDILAFLRLVHSSNDFVSFSRTINLPKRGIGDTTLEKIRIGAVGASLSILGYCEALVDDQGVCSPLKLTLKQKEGLREYVKIIRYLKSKQSAYSLKELVEAVIEMTGYIGYLKEDMETYQDRVGNLDSLIAKAIEWQASAETPTLSGFLEELSLRSTLDDAVGPQEKVNLMTIHNGKGLEFEVTFLAGLEEELFPHVNSRNLPEGIEEERRLFYVGMTRAKEFLYLTDCRSRFIWGVSRTQRPSRFIREIPPQYLEKARKPNKEIQFSRSPHYSEEALFAAGDAVFHKDFGVGIVRDIKQGSIGITYKIQFADESERNIVAQHAQLIKL